MTRPGDGAFTVHAASDRGRVREGNEDSLFAGTTVFAVADGMGGHQAGEVASETALEPLRALDGRPFPTAQAAEQALREAIATANRSVVAKAAAEPSYRGMGTTLTAVLVRDAALHVAHVGDSRAYLLRRHAMSQLTTDHTLVEQLVQEGRLSRDEIATHPQRSVITRAIGVDPHVEVDSLSPIAMRPGDQLLLCSDGLTGPVDDEEIAEILASTPDGDAACQALIEAANAAGGPDNITVVLLRVAGEPGDDDERPGVSTDRLPDLGGAVAAPPAPVKADVQIRTREESGTAWDAKRMGHVGAPQGVDTRRVARLSPRRRRVASIVLGAVALGALVVLGGWLLLSRAYFLGVDDGRVAIFQGLPGEVAGVALHRVLEDTELDVAQLDTRLQQRLEGGIEMGTVDEARRTVEGYRRAARDASEARSAATASPAPATSPPPPTPVTSPTTAATP